MLLQTMLSLIQSVAVHQTFNRYNVNGGASNTSNLYYLLRQMEHQVQLISWYAENTTYDLREPISQEQVL